MYPPHKILDLKRERMQDAWGYCERATWLAPPVAAPAWTIRFDNGTLPPEGPQEDIAEAIRLLAEAQAKLDRALGAVG